MMSDISQPVYVEPMMIYVEKKWDLESQEDDLDAFYSQVPEHFEKQPLLKVTENSKDLLLVFKRAPVAAKAIQIIQAGVYVSPIMETRDFSSNWQVLSSSLGNIKPDKVRNSLGMHVLNIDRFDWYVEIDETVSLLIPVFFERLDYLRRKSLSGDCSLPDEVILTAYIMGITKY
jgi:hypothetical protein